MARLKVVDESNTPEAAAARARWATYPAPNAKPQTCAFCGVALVVVCATDEQSASCGQLWVKNARRKVEKPIKPEEPVEPAEGAPVKRGRGRPRKIQRK